MLIYKYDSINLEAKNYLSGDYLCASSECHLSIQKEYLKQMETAVVRHVTRL